jgi:hypothetical protein
MTRWDWHWTHQRGIGYYLKLSVGLANACQRGISTPLQKSYGEMQDDELIALASIYGEDFRRLDSYRGGLKMFEIGIKSSDEDVAVKLRVALPAKYPKTAPLLEFVGDGMVRLPDGTQDDIQKIIESMPKKLVLKEEPMIMEIVSGCGARLERNAFRAAGQEGNQQALAAVLEKPMITVYVNDGLGTETPIPCLASDGVDVFRAKVAVAIGRPAHEIVLKQGRGLFEDQFALEDYGVQDGAQLDLQLYRGSYYRGDKLDTAVSRRRYSDDDDICDDNSGRTGRRSRSGSPTFEAGAATTAIAGLKEHFESKSQQHDRSRSGHGSELEQKLPVQVWLAQLLQDCTRNGKLKKTTRGKT